MTSIQSSDYTVDSCRLCARHDVVLCDSHIMPAFVYRYLKSGSVTGYMIGDDAPNLRIQDGPKRPLLCHDCEQRFSRWESAVAENIFRPLHAGEDFRVRYGSWFCAFCASVIWRVLIVALEEKKLDEMPTSVKARFTVAAEAWREFLLGAAPTPAPFSIYAVPMPRIKKGPRDLPRNINRYLLRTVDASLAHVQGSSYVFAKLCKLLVAGTVTPRRRWRDGKVHVGGGAFSAGDYRLPQEFNEIFYARAKAHAAVYGERSARQLDRTTTTYEERLRRGEWTEDMSAFWYDYSLFGDEASS